ncbi:unnamed protein product [Euphydryas editha]|uniref:Uncharacterized protein n=1 Tax=Euphydryas editha TaxID=104508 RepID=A0AAU9TCA2_EUPED|nr:unnamed protein product [Euphydryas editha]
MSDSDEDFMPNNGLKYKHDPVGFNATNSNNTNITSYTFRNNMMTSTSNMPYLDRQRYEMRGFDQRSVNYRRETSPMSLRSFPNLSFQRSVFNGRSGSPMSMRSIDSNASAADIVSVLKNGKYNNHDLRMLKDTINKLMKNRFRKRIEKRRNLKLYSKGNRRRSGEDSGEQGSDSSISGDDCRSSRTNLNKENITKSINRPLKTYDLTQVRTSIKESNIYKDCTENLKQNSFRNMFAVNKLNHKRISEEKGENTSVVTLKERFTKGASFQLPSQRFNKSKLINNETSVRHMITENPRINNNICNQPESTKYA